jgi:two-component system, NarL family, nitrate/nitrite response regulator NarL
MTRILLIDDHVLFRESLARLLGSEPGVEVTAQCGTVDEALKLIDQHPYDLMLLDYELGDRRGNEVVTAAKTRGIPARIVILTVGLTKPEYRQMTQHGVAGVFLKNNPPELLSEALKTVLAGGTWFDPQYEGASGSEPGAGPFRQARFTERDRQVLRGVFEGMANKEIAERLQVSESAIKASLQQLFAKTGVRTRSQLVRLALEKFRKEIV